MCCPWMKVVAIASILTGLSNAIVTNTSSSLETTISSSSPTTSSSLDLAWLRSPQCTSSYEAFLSAGGAYNENACCGTCSIYWQQVEVKYFPATNANYDCLKSIDPSWATAQDPTYPQTRTPINTGNIPIPFPTTTAPAVVRRDNSSEIQIAVGPDGFTYTSPYIYVVLETVDALDQCGARGGFYTSLTWSFLPGQISTVEGREGPTKTFDIADLPCPPSAVATADWYNYKPGEPYRPELAPLPQLWELDPLFQNCYIDIYEGFDPPHALTPQAGLVITTSAALPLPTPAKPSISIEDPLPVYTSVSGGGGTHISRSTSADLGEPETQTNQPNTKHTTSLPTITAIPSTQTTTPLVIGTNTISAGPSGVIIGSQTLQPGSAITIGTNIISLGSSPEPSAVVIDGSTIAIGPAAAPSAPGSSFAVGGQVITSQSGGYVVAGQTLSAGGSAVVVSGTTLSLASNSLVVGSSTFALPSSSSAAPSILSDGGVVTGDASRGLDSTLHLMVAVSLSMLAGAVLL